MRWWKRAAGILVVGALLALVTVWTLREANVIRWGAAGAALDRIEALEDTMKALEQQAARSEQEPPEDRFIVVNLYVESFRNRAGTTSASYCVRYAAPGGNQEHCNTVVPTHPPDPDDSKQQAMVESNQWIQDCFLSAVIGEPLPACWR